MMNMISANFFNFDPANAQKPGDNTKNNLSEKEFAAFLDKLRVVQTTASLTPPNTAPTHNETAETTENVPICIKTSSANLPVNSTPIVIAPTTNQNLPETDLPLPSPPVFELPVETPPIKPALNVEVSEIKGFETQTPPIAAPPAREKNVEIVVAQTPPIIVAPPPNSPTVKTIPTAHTPPIIVNPPQTNPTVKTPPVNIETPPIIEPPIVVVTPPIIESPAPVETPPILPAPPVIKAETPIVKPPIVAQTPPIVELPVETPPILVTPNPNGKLEIPVETPPILVTPTPTGKNEKTVETPPIIELPPPPAPPKIVSLNSNTKRIERNVENTPPIITPPAPQNTPPKFGVLKSNTKRVETNVEDTPPIIVQPTNGGTVKNPSKDFTVPTIDLAAQRFVIGKETGKVLRRETDSAAQTPVETPPIIIAPPASNNEKTNLKPLMRDSAQILNAEPANVTGKDFTPVLTANNISAISFSTVAASAAETAATPVRIHNVLYNFASPKYAASEVKPHVVFPSELRVKSATPENLLTQLKAEATETVPLPETILTTAEAETNVPIVNSFANAKPIAEHAANVLEFRKPFENLPSNAAFAERGTLSENSPGAAKESVPVFETGAEIFTKEVFPKRETFDSIFESANVFARGERTGVKTDTPEIVKTNQSETPQLPEQIAPQILEMAAKVEQTKEKQILKMRLHPAELGTVEIQLEKNSHGQMHAQLATETEAARASLSENLDQLRAALEKSGWQVGTVEIVSSGNLTNSFGGSQRHGENAAQNQYQTFSQTESGTQFSQSENAQKDDHQRIVSLRA